jgi:ACS family hexuronate transporter-like MFS transporter
MKVGNYRWRIVALLFSVTTINYIDRQVLSFVMTDDLFKKAILGLPKSAVLTAANIKAFKVQMGFIDSAFKTTYAIGFFLSGWLIDKIGTKKGFSLGMIIWSIAGLLSSFVSTVTQFKLVRALLGIGESANFPAAVKTIAEWFPRKERSAANGILNAASNMGVIATALLIPFIITNYGWRNAFLVSGFLGFAMLAIYHFVYSKPTQTKKLLAKELDYILAEDTEGFKKEHANVRLSWKQLAGYRQTWVFATVKICSDPVWFFYLTWLPDFFMTNDALDKKLDLKNFGLPFLIIYVVSDIGSIFFGWLATTLMKNGWSENKARKITMLMCALLVMPIFVASSVHNINIAIAIMAIATAAHQGWSTNVYSLASNLFPSGSVASVTGIGGMLGGITSIFVAAITGIVVANFGYKPMFIFAGLAYLVGLVIIHLILPNLQSIQIKSPTEVVAVEPQLV